MKSKILGSIGGRILLLFGRKQKTSDSEAIKSDFKTSTQKMGISFSDKIRNVFRHRWIKRK